MSTESNINVLSLERSDDTKSGPRPVLWKIPGLKIIEAADTADALQKLRDNKIDVALVDLDAPGVGGIELTKQIRSAQPTVRVIISTSSDNAEDIFGAVAAGADGYVLKENSAKVIEVAIRSVKLGTVFLDPGIARQILHLMETATTTTPSRVLQTGLLRIPFLPDEHNLLTKVASSNCIDGVCMIDPSFVARLRRLSPT
jgi:DNA-binding NarL/FixJ family response regulator